MCLWAKRNATLTSRHRCECHFACVIDWPFRLQIATITTSLDVENTGASAQAYLVHAILAGDEKHLSHIEAKVDGKTVKITKAKVNGHK